MIHILWPTLRTEQFTKSFSFWLSKAGWPIKQNDISKILKIHVLVSTELERIFLDKYFKSLFTSGEFPYRIVVFKPEHPGVCEPSYKLSSTLEYNPDDIIILASDDFFPPDRWDEYLINKFNGVLFVRDGYQNPDSSNMLHPAITIPIMTGDALTKMNKIIYHPQYIHLFSDCELYLTAKDLGILVDNRVTDPTTFEHHHHAAGKRNADKHDQSYYGKWKEDEVTWNERKNMPVEERIKI